MKKIFIVLLILILAFSTNSSFSQKNLVYSEPTAEYEKGLELFNKEKYNAAQDCFSKTIDAIDDPQSEMRISAEYYSAICAIELYHTDAESQLTKFISNHTDNSRVKLANYQLGKLQYRQKKFEKAAKTFDKVDVYDLNNEDLSEFYFDFGYADFMLKKYDEAKKSFFELINTDTKFLAPANYYYAHINYIQKNYETALKSFLKIEKNVNFGPIVPYYIAQIYYLQGKYDEAIKYAQPLLDSSTTKRIDEISRIVGESYFYTSQYSKAIPFLEKYIVTTSNTLSRQDFYKIGYAYYKTGTDYSAAIDYLTHAVNANDSLSQNAYYLLGDSYLKTKNKKFALSAFESAYKLKFYPEIKEDALFNYAKLCYELSLNPYNKAISSLQEYITKYPNSDKIDEARTYLINLFFTTKNYKAALASIEKLKNRDEKMNEAFQKIAYYWGVELFNNKKIKDAIGMFDKSNTQPMDNTIKAQCYYWKAEGYYRLLKFDSALVNYDKFMLLPGAYSLSYFNTANYNIGYCYFKQKEYKSANKSFRKFLKGKSDESPKLFNDAYLRVADCYYVSKEYESASEYYEKAIDIKIFDVDYAMFQKALCLGALGKYDSKIGALQNMLTEYPKTFFADDANFELANTYMIKNDNDNALLYFNKIIKDYPNSSYAKRSLLKIGLIYFNTDKSDLALQTYKKVVVDYPATPESKSALESMLNVYMTIDKVDSFYVWVKNRGIEYGSKTEQDSVTYMASETKYMNGECDKALKGFGNYVQQFPEGYFVSNANYYMAECNYKNNLLEDALKEYAFVAAQQKNKFSEYAVEKAAEICYKLNRYDSAANYYTTLENNAEYKYNVVEARTMKMRCYSKEKKNDKALAAARALIATEKVSNEALSEAHITIARAALAMDSIPLAQTEYEFTYKFSPTSEFGAEAKYDLAYIQYMLKDYTLSEKMIFEVINQVPSYDYWIAKSFILLSDVYVSKSNIVQAKATLQSIIDNYEGSDLVTIAHDKLNKIILAEKGAEQTKTPEEIQIKFDNNPKNDKLFDDNVKPTEDKKNE